MAKPPAFQFYPNDFMDATRFWPAFAVGLYVRLLCVQWTHGAVPGEFAIIAKGIGCTVEELESCWNLIGPKFQKTEQGLVNERLEAVRQRQEHVSAMRSQANKRRTNAPTNTTTNASTKSQQRKEKEKEKDTMVLHDTSKDINDVHGIHVSHDARAEIWPTFDDWWTAYGKKIDRPKCEAKWARMSRSDRELAYRHTEAYVIATPDVTFRRHPATYLNNRNWNDDDLTRPRGQSSGKRPEQLTREERRAMVLAEVAKYNAGVDGGTGGKS